MPKQLITEKKFCPHCHRELTPSDIDGYPWVCKHCDENFYDFEANTINDYVNMAKQELYDNKKKPYVDHLISLQGKLGIAYQALEEMYYHGKFKYPSTYLHKKKLTQYVRESIKIQSSNWLRTKW